MRPSPALQTWKGLQCFRLTWITTPWPQVRCCLSCIFAWSWLVLIGNVRTGFPGTADVGGDPAEMGWPKMYLLDVNHDAVVSGYGSVQ